MEVQIIPYQPEHKVYFEKLNKEWLEEYFVVEPIDKWVLENPEEAILETGGLILFASTSERIIGTVALKRAGADAFELTKMAVEKQLRGHGVGKELCKAAIHAAGALGASRLILYSQTSLGTAINIYRKMGFKEIPLEPGKYARADIKMELLLE